MISAGKTPIGQLKPTGQRVPVGTLRRAQPVGQLKPVSSGQRDPQVVFKGTQGVVNLPGVQAEEAAKLSAKEQFARQGESEFFDEVSSLGVPFADIKFEDVLKVSDGNIRLAKDFITLRNSAIGAPTGQEKAAKSLQSILEELSRLGDAIPASTGFVGKNLQGPFNALRAQLGQIPEKDVFDNMVALALPLIRKASGDSGNIGESEQQIIKPAVIQLGSPFLEERRIGRESLRKVFSEGFKVDLNLGGKVPPAKRNQQERSAIKELSDEELERIAFGQ